MVVDLAVYGAAEAYEALTSEDVCRVCEPGMWSLISKNLETLLD